MSGDGDFSFTRSLMSGAVAGTAVDVALFPLDTVKTRMQSGEGFWKAGGFRGVYKGIVPVILGSAPGAALFFSTYEAGKHYLPNDRPALNHMGAACLGEVGACLVRVPTETVKQKMQMGQYNTLATALRGILKDEGFVGGLYRGYPVTVCREIPFALIQFPLWESLKSQFAYDEHGKKNDIMASACGAFAGGLAAAVTTPLDVAKTRIMLGKDRNGVAYDHKVGSTLMRILKDEGFTVLFSGLIPRVKIISIGGLIFFGAYEHTESYLRANNIA
eukprot:TRINITY_DN50861_c0_g1_i1.p2 TRINITY_DN50861_c0_g1~~TRINITY_DN50861_c0_g1_i1.p2  ORF type:complete len:274 (+),score=109.54 TRINITY_DN50861_c0_g1_i1:60-881(+)